MSNLSAHTRPLIRLLCLASLIALLALAAFAPATALADDNENPTVALLLYGRHPVYQLFGKAVLDMFEAYGYINADERATLEDGSDLHGENINILNREAGFDFATANLMVEDALDEGADILLTVSNEVGMLAASAMDGMDDPPALVFAIVTDPTSTGIIQSACVKPANVTGTQMYFDPEFYEEFIFAQNPELDAYGILVDSSDPSRQLWIDESKAYAERHGLRVEIGSGLTASDWQLAAQTLMSADVDAIVLVPRTSDPERGISAIIDEAHGVPVYSLIVTDVYQGVTIASGFNGWYSEGHTAARMIIGHLRGTFDIATTGVNTTQAVATAINLDSAARQEVTISDGMLAMADFVLEGGEGAGITLEVPGITTVLEEMTLEERIAADQVFLESLHCSDEMIAEQQAQLDAADG